MKKFYQNTDDNENLFSNKSDNDFANKFKSTSLPPIQKGKFKKE